MCLSAADAVGGVRVTLGGSHGNDGSLHAGRPHTLPSVPFEASTTHTPLYRSVHSARGSPWIRLSSSSRPSGRTLRADRTAVPMPSVGNETAPTRIDWVNYPALLALSRLAAIGHSLRAGLYRNDIVPRDPVRGRGPASSYRPRFGRGLSGPPSTVRVDCPADLIPGVLALYPEMGTGVEPVRGRRSRVQGAIQSHHGSQFTRGSYPPECVPGGQSIRVRRGGI